jgi:hypothetical protein
MHGPERPTPPPAGSRGTLRVGPGSRPDDLERAADILNAGPPPGPRLRRHLAEQPRPAAADPFASGSAEAADERPGTGEQPDKDSGGFGPWFYAAYSGECAGCWCIIDEGDLIRADGEGGYLCEGCGED